MNKQEFEQKEKEMQEKLNKAVDLSSMECMMTQVGYTVHMDNVLKKPFHVLCENNPDHGGISVAISGNKMQLWFAIATILHNDGEEEFYHNLAGVVSAEEIIQSAITCERMVIKPNSSEELKVYEELMKKNPEELENIKSQIEK